MKEKLFGILICFLLVLICFFGIGTNNATSFIQQKNLVNDNYTTIKEDIDWWPMFHHDVSLTGYSTSSTPDTNNLLWNHALNEDIRFSSNSVNDNRLFIGTGKFWNAYKNAVLDIKELHEFLDPINFNIFSNGCKKKTIFSDEGAIYCLDATNGDEKWNFRITESIASSPVIINNRVYFSSADYYTLLGNIYCLDASNGDIIWNNTIYSYFTSPIVYDEKIYIGTIEEGPGSEPIGFLVCLDALTGVEEWKYNIGKFNFALYSCPSFYNGNIYTTSINKNQTQLHCVNSLNGNGVWITNLTIMNFGLAISSPTIDDGKVFVICAETEKDDFWTKVFCIDSINGDIIWDYSMIDEVIEVSFSTPAVNNDRIYYFSNGGTWSYGRIYCHDALSGDIIWDKKTEDCYTFSSPAISSDDKLFIGAFSPKNGKNKILCYDISNGDISWEYILDGIASVDSSPAIANKRIYISTGTGEIYAFQDAFEIKEITGGFASVKANIANIWNDDLYEIDCSLSVSGGLFEMINITVNDRIEVLEAETTDIIRAFPIIGFGDINIKISVNIANCGKCTKTKQGSVFGFFVKV